MHSIRLVTILDHSLPSLITLDGKHLLRNHEFALEAGDLSLGVLNERPDATVFLFYDEDGVFGGDCSKIGVSETK